MIRISVIWLGLLTFFLASSFVLLGLHEARLDISEDDPVVVFHWSGTTEVEGLDIYRDGVYQEASSEEVLRSIISHALDNWSQVEGSFIEFQLIPEPLEDSEGSENSDSHYTDGKHVITLMGEGTVSGWSIPIPAADNFSIISDCTVVINGNPIHAYMLEMVITHELGHCMGLGHPHTSVHAVMSYNSKHSALAVGLFRMKGVQLSVSDKAGATYLYPKSTAKGYTTPLHTCGSLGQSRFFDTAGFPAMKGLWWLWIFLPLLGGFYQPKNPASRNKKA